MFKTENSFFSKFKFKAEEEEEEDVDTPQEEEDEDEDEDDEDDEEELVDPKIAVDHHCEHHCETEFKEYLACAERIKLLPEGTHCHSWYTDFKGCIAHCAADELFSKLK
eukprot:gene4621-8194_t